MESTKLTRGRQKIRMKRIENEDDRLVTFSKRRSGIYKKSSELITLCGAEVGVLVFSPAGTPFAFGHPSMESVMGRFMGKDTAPKDLMTHPLVEAHRKVRINELNEQHNEMVNRLDAEKERAQVLKRILKGKVGEYRGWWDVPVDELNLEEMKQMLTRFEELHIKVCNKIIERSVYNAIPSSSAPMFFHTTGFGAINELASSSCFPQGHGF